MVSGRWAAGLLLGLGMVSTAASVSAETGRTLPDFETVRSSIPNCFLAFWVSRIYLFKCISLFIPSYHCGCLFFILK